MPMPTPLLVEEVRRGDKRGLKYNFHPGQKKAWNSRKRTVLVLAGVRGGKSSFGPLWLHRECIARGPGDYLIAAPSLKLIDKATGPEFEHHFATRLKLGTITRRPWEFTFSETGARKLWGVVPERRCRVLFGHADDPDSLAAMTVKAAWLDECGQKRFRLPSWQEIQARTSFDQGRHLLTTRPYDLGWLKTELFDHWESAGRNHPDIDVVRFDSTENPAFPKEEFERARRTLPRWRFDLMYRALFTRPAGLIYDTFDPMRHVVPRFRLPDHWPRGGGADFGATNTAAVLFAEELNLRNEPTGRRFAYKEHHPAEKWDIDRHVKALLDGEPCIPDVIGGNPAEEDWRDRFCRAGLPMRAPPVKDVEVGIDAMYSACSQGQMLVMDDLVELLDELASYSRVVDDNGKPTAEIDGQSTYHLLDACRYYWVWHARGSGTWDLRQPAAARSEMSKAEDEGLFIEDGSGTWE
jgi:hypothetical protein